MTESSKKILQASLTVRATLGEVNRLIASESVQEVVIGKRLRTKLTGVRNTLHEILDTLEEK